MASVSPIRSEIDFDAHGKHEGYLRLPYSVHRSAYGWIPIPVVSIHNGAGPRVVLMAGNHGDEYEGQVALTNLAQQLDEDDVAGQILILPAVNTPAAIAGSRTSPLDGGNLNRSFPGNASGTPTQIIAHYLEHVLFPGCNYLLDLHSGGTSLLYLPTALVRWGISDVDDEKQLGLLAALGLPYALLFEIDEDGSFATSAMARAGGVGMTLELGGGGVVDGAVLTLIEDGLRRYLRHIGVCPTLDTRTAMHTPRLLYADDDSQYVHARVTGVFEPVAELGENVAVGQLAGRIHTPETPWKISEDVYFDCAGIVLCKRALARTEPGDCLFQLGHDTS